MTHSQVIDTAGLYTVITHSAVGSTECVILQAQESPLAIGSPDHFSSKTCGLGMKLVGINVAVSL